MLHVVLLTIFWIFSSAAAWASVDVNSAGQSELETLPGIGPSKAAAIVEHRNQHGPFSTVSQLDDVPGIGPATLANISPLVVIGATDTTTNSDTIVADESSDTTATATVSSSTGNRVNINAATADALDSLPGIGPAKANAILEDRTNNGPFADCHQLQRVTGIGPATVATLQDFCSIE